MKSSELIYKFIVPKVEPNPVTVAWISLFRRWILNSGFSKSEHVLPDQILTANLLKFRGKRKKKKVTKGAYPFFLVSFNKNFKAIHVENAQRIKTLS